MACMQTYKFAIAIENFNKIFKTLSKSRMHMLFDLALDKCHKQKSHEKRSLQTVSCFFFRFSRFSRFNIPLG